MPTYPGLTLSGFAPQNRKEKKKGKGRFDLARQMILGWIQEVKVMGGGPQLEDMVFGKRVVAKRVLIGCSYSLKSNLGFPK